MKQKAPKNKSFEKNRFLIDECRKSNPKAQFEIYKLYYHSMFNTSFRILNNSMEAEDVMQEAFLSAFENIDNYKGEVSFGAWLKRIVINKSIDTLRKRQRLAEEPLGQHDTERFIETDIDEADAEQYDIEMIKDEISVLPEGFRIVLTLYLLEGYDHDEISGILGISGSTSRSQYSRAKKKLLLNLQKKKHETRRTDK